MFVTAFLLNSRCVSPTHIHWRADCRWWLDSEWTPDLCSWVCNTLASLLNSGPSYVACQRSDVIKSMRWNSHLRPLFQDDPHKTRSAAWWRALEMKIRQFSVENTTIFFGATHLLGVNLTKLIKNINIVIFHFNFLDLTYITICTYILI